MEKNCAKCKKQLDSTSFYSDKSRPDGKARVCKRCDGEGRRARALASSEQRKTPEYRERARQNRKRYAQNNREHRLELRKQRYYLNHEKILAAARNQQVAYRAKNRDKKRLYMRVYQRERLKTDVLYRLSRGIRARLKIAIQSNAKTGSAVSDLGCTIPELKTYLEARFKPGMTWENWGRIGWHVDHIVPLASFDLTDREQFLRACRYTNLQPLWATENLSKGAK